MSDTKLGLIITLFSVAGLVFIAGWRAFSTAVILFGLVLFMELWRSRHHLGRGFLLLAREIGQHTVNLLKVAGEQGIKAFPRATEGHTPQEKKQEQEALGGFAFGMVVIITLIAGLVDPIAFKIAAYAPAPWSLRLLLLGGIALTWYGLYQIVKATGKGASHGAHSS